MAEPQNHRCKRYRVTPAGNRGYGLICCTGMTPWRDLEARVEGDRWIWSCSKCHGWLRRDPWNPPSDLPQISPSEALESAVGYQEPLWTVERETEPPVTELAAF